MATASPFDAALRDVLDALSAATQGLEWSREPEDVAQTGAELALRLTRSLDAVVALEDGRRFAAGSGNGPVGGALVRAELRAQGQALGTLTVGRSVAYSDEERVALELFAAHVALALVVTGSWAGSGHEETIAVLEAVSSHAIKGGSLDDFFRRLARTLAELVGAGRVLFWRLGADGMLSPVQGGYRTDEAFLSRLKPTRCEPGGDDLASRVVFGDLIFRAPAADAPPEHAHVLEVLGVSSAISVPWRAGEERLGLVAAYDTTRPGGFSSEDARVLEMSGLAAGPVTRLRQTQEDLRKSLERLTKVDSARQLLLRSMSTAVEKERKRFVSELHDDALQKLTAAELEVARLDTAGAAAGSLEKLRSLLEETETALRRLIFEARPPSLDSPDGLAQSIRDRVTMLTGSGLEVELDLDLPGEMETEVRTVVFRQMAEVIGNVERHSEATRVQISVKIDEGGVLGVVRDNGRGFDVAERTNLPGHLGLLALRERALMAGGRYKIDSRPGAGTRVEFWIPLVQ